MADVSYGPRSRINAQSLLDAAAHLRLDPSVVRTTRNGYIVPEEIIAHIEALSSYEEGKEYPDPNAPTRPAVNEPKAAWSEYAVLIGLEVIEEMTKADLIDLVKTAEAGKENG